MEQERLRRLLDVGRSLVEELDPDVVLDRLLEVAQELTGARYAAIGVLDERRELLEQFITKGIDEETHRAIGDRCVSRTSGRTRSRTGSRSRTRRCTRFWASRSPCAARCGGTST
jgi:GAF domain-containing protein